MVVAATAAASPAAAMHSRQAEPAEVVAPDSAQGSGARRVAPAPSSEVPEAAVQAE